MNRFITDALLRPRQRVLPPHYYRSFEDWALVEEVWPQQGVSVVAAKISCVKEGDWKYLREASSGEYQYCLKAVEPLRLSRKKEHRVILKILDNLPTSGYRLFQVKHPQLRGFIMEAFLDRGVQGGLLLKRLVEPRQYFLLSEE